MPVVDMFAAIGTTTRLDLPLASNVAFGVVFGVFIAAFVVLAVVTMTWAVRRDRPGREAWRQRMLERREGWRRSPPGSQSEHRGVDHPRQNGSADGSSST